jgi:two-component system response regulator HydG
MKNIFKNDPAITLGRVLVVTIMTGSAVALNRLGALPLNFMAIFGYGLGFIGLAIGLRMVTVKMVHGIWDYGQMALNVAWIFLFLRITGGPENPFSLLFFLAIIAAANSRLAKGAIFTATLSSIAYGSLLAIEYQTLKQASVFPDAVDFFSAFSADFLFRGYVYAICFYLVAAFAGLLAERLQVKGRQLEDATRAWEEFRLSTGDILERMGSGLLTVSSQGQIKYCNRAGSEILGLNAATVIGNDFRRVFSEGLAEITSILNHSIENNIQKINRYEVSLTLRNGIEIPLGISISAIRGADGQLQGIIAIFQDLTEAKRIENRLQEVERLQNIKELAQNLLQVVKPAIEEMNQAVETLREGHQGQVGYEVAEIFRQKVEVIRKTLADFIRFASIESPEFISQNRQTDENEGAIIGQHPKFLDVLRLVRQVASSDSTVLISGESGTGKEILAKELHRLSARNSGPFVSINCAALPETLLESELFGHVKGSFTGAIRDKEGLFRVAESGTFFLDEVSETSPAIQVKLLRVLQEREVVPVGGSRPIKVDVRLVSATNADLMGAVEQGKFRRDLYYRLNVIQIVIPPLRERGQDVIQLAEYFLARSCRKQNRPPKSLSPSAVRVLVTYSWPGNVRELQNVMERATVLCKGNVVNAEHLPAEILRRGKSVGSVARTGPRTISSAGGTLREEERNRIMSTLEECGGNKTLAARRLGIHYATLYRKLKQYGI